MVPNSLLFLFVSWFLEAKSILSIVEETPSSMEPEAPAHPSRGNMTGGFSYDDTDAFIWYGRELLTIPQSLIDGETVQAFEDWLMSSTAWHQSNGQSLLKALKALNAWRRERFVRRNVRRETFAQWRVENPRYFITPRERRYLEYLRAKLLTLRAQD
jgi:hypothetical protein